MEAPTRSPSKRKARVNKGDGCPGDLSNLHSRGQTNIFCIEEKAADHICCSALPKPRPMAGSGKAANWSKQWSTAVVCACQSVEGGPTPSWKVMPNISAEHTSCTTAGGGHWWQHASFEQHGLRLGGIEPLAAGIPKHLHGL